MPIATKSGGLILKDGRLATNCDCCCFIGGSCVSSSSDSESWVSCRVDAPTIQVFGATFMLDSFNRLGWLASSVLWDTSTSGNVVALVNGLLYRVGSDTPSNSMEASYFSNYPTCSYKYFIRSNTIQSVANLAIEYPPDKVPGTPLNEPPSPIRQADFFSTGTQLSPEFTQFGGNSWQLLANGYTLATNTLYGTETFSFSDGNTIYPNPLP